MRPHHKPLFVVLIAALALASGCSSGTLPEQRVEAKIAEAAGQQGSTAVAAIVKARKANIREHPSEFAAVVRTVAKGDLLSLIDAAPTGPWYRIRDSKTGADGWIHGNTIELLQTAETSAATTTSAARPRTVSTSTGTSTPTREESRTVSTSTQTSRAAATTPAAPSGPSDPDNPPPSCGRSYANVDGIRVQSPTFSETTPAGASARCRDGSYSFSLNRRGTCSHHGGVAEWY